MLITITLHYGQENYNVALQNLWCTPALLAPSLKRLTGYQSGLEHQASKLAVRLATDPTWETRT
jgi:hypothetical protein